MDKCTLSGGALPQQNALDLGHLDAQTQGDRGLQRELLCLFTAQSPGLIARMEALGSEETRTLEDLAHRLKGSALAIGAFGVAAAADRVGQAASGAEAPPLTALVEALAAVEAAIAAHLEAWDATDRPESGPAGA